MSQKNGGSGLVFGKFPGVIKSYNPDTRECIIQTPTGDAVDAEIEYPIGDISAVTEIKISKGDKVWCEYIQGDTRRALITGYRNPKSGNSAGTRKWNHANFVLHAESSIKLQVEGLTLEITSSDVIANGVSLINHVHFIPRTGADSEIPKK